MTTYNTYQEAKIANPECEIFHVNGICFFNYEALASDICNPADYCMTVERFLADGYEFVDGDILLSVFGDIIEVGIDYTVRGANLKLDTDNKRCILRAAALEEKEPELTKDDSPQGIISAISNRLHNIGCEHQDSELGEELGSMACDIWGVLPFISNESIEEKKPRTKVEYVKVTDSIFDLRPDFEAGELFSKVNHARDYSAINNTQTLAQALHQSCCYRRIETPTTEREAFVEAACEIADEKCKGFNLNIDCSAAMRSVIEEIATSGKFKLVNHDSNGLKDRIRAVAEWEMNTSNNHDWESVAESIYCAVDDLLNL